MAYLFRDRPPSAISMALTVFGLLLINLTASGATITVFNNFGPGDTFVHNGGQAIGVIGGIKTAAMPFTPGGNYTLDRIEVAVSLVSGTNQLDVFLTNSANGLPGLVLESYHFSGAMGLFATSNIPILSANSALHPLLQIGLNTGCWQQVIRPRQCGTIQRMWV